MKFGRLQNGLIKAQPETAPSNFISNPTPLKDTTGWSLYSDAAGTAPVDGTGGSVNTGTEINWSRTTSSPLSETASFLFSKIATSSMQGKGVSYDFTVNHGDKSKVCRIDFDYEVASGTYADGDLTVWLYDVTNGGNPIQPSASSILNAIGPQKKQPLSFQTNSNSTSYRLIIHVASTSASAYTVKFDNVSVTRESTAGTNQIAARYSTGAGQSIPNGGSETIIDFGARTFDTANAVTTGASWKFTAPISGKYEVSSFIFFNSGGGWAANEDAQLVLFKNGAFNSYLDVYVSPTTHSARIGLSGKTTIDLNAGEYFDVRAYQGSGAALSLLNSGNTNYIDIKRLDTAVASQDAETRVVAGWVGGSSTTITSGAGATTVIYGTKVEDTHGDTYNTSTGAWTCKIPGWYQFDYQIVDGTITPASADRSIQISLGVDGAGEYGIAQIPTLNTVLRGIILNGSFKLKLRAGQVVRVRAESSLGDTYTVLNNTGYSYLQWNMIQGPAQIAASEAVVFSGRNGAGTGFVGVTTIPFATVDVDTHGGYSAGIYTVKTPGMYEITSTVMLESQSWTAGSEFVYRIMVDGSTVRAAEWIAPRTATQYGSSVTVSAIIRLNVGQTINFAANQTESGAARNLITGGAYNTASIKRIG